MELKVTLNLDILGIYKLQLNIFLVAPTCIQFFSIAIDQGQIFPLKIDL